MEMWNTSTVVEFILLSFPSLHHVRSLCFLVVLLMYTLSLLGNGFILFIVFVDPKLQTPMYGFLCNVAFLEICYTSVVVPKLMQTFLSARTTICFRFCVAQFFIIFSFGAVELLHLSVMAFDRYVAICHPLRYPAIMTKTLCFHLSTGSWLVGLTDMFIHTVMLWTLPFCDANIIDHFFCDFGPVISLACSNTRHQELVAMLSSVFFGLFTFLLIVVSYVYIISAILRIPSASGRKKAFSTCTSHLTVVSLTYGAIMFMYMRPNAHSSFHFSKAVSVMYTIVASMLNPFIYTIRNVEVKQAFRRALSRKGNSF